MVTRPGGVRRPSGGGSSSPRPRRDGTTPTPGHTPVVVPTRSPWRRGWSVPTCSHLLRVRGDTPTVGHTFINPARGASTPAPPLRRGPDDLAVTGHDLDRRDPRPPRRRLLALACSAGCRTMPLRLSCRPCNVWALRPTASVSACSADHRGAAFHPAGLLQPERTGRRRARWGPRSHGNNSDAALDRDHPRPTGSIGTQAIDIVRRNPERLSSAPRLRRGSDLDLPAPPRPSSLCRSRSSASPGGSVDEPAPPSRPPLWRAGGIPAAAVCRPRRERDDAAELVDVVPNGIITGAPPA